MGEKTTNHDINSIQPLGPHLCRGGAITLSVYAVSYEFLENNYQRVVVEHAVTAISLPFKQDDWLDQSLQPKLNTESCQILSVRHMRKQISSRLSPTTSVSDGNALRDWFV